MIKGVVFDFGNTLIRQVSDVDKPLHLLPLALLPGARECIGVLSGRYSIAILSNTETTTSQQLRLAMANLFLGLTNIAIVTSVSAGYKKPHAEIFHMIARAMGLNVTDLLMVGNDPVEDIRGAKAVGMRTVFVGHTGNVRPPEADGVITTLRELTPDFIRSLDSKTVDGSTGGHRKNVVRPHHGAKPISGDDPDADTPGNADDMMKLAVDLEGDEPWRQIGTAWLRCAESLSRDTATRSEYVDAEATAHSFPHFSFTKWRDLSLKQKAGRAYRYAGYHFEDDGDRQSAYRLYRLSAVHFEQDRMFDEASRSHYLAVSSYARRFGEVEPSYLKDLQRTTEASVAYDKLAFLRRMVIYYRRLSAVARASGNHGLYVVMRRHRLEAERMLARRWQTAHQYGWLTFWKAATAYGQSVSRWIVSLGIVTVLMVPIADFAFCSAENTSFRRAVQDSMARLSGNQLVSSHSRPCGTVQATQSLFNLIWLGMLVNILALKAQE